jgi:translation elongation factor EF-G
VDVVQDVSAGEEPVALECRRGGPLVALAFKLEEGRFGQLTYMRIYSGSVRKGDFVVNVGTGKKIKVRGWKERRRWGREGGRDGSGVRG